jgi:hypothetical protein
MRPQHLPLSGRIQSERGFVEDHHDGILDQCPGDAEALPHATAVGGDPRAGSVTQADLVEQAPGHQGGFRSRPAEEARVIPQIGEAGLLDRVTGTAAVYRFKAVHLSRSYS